jgi:hypothetical protein
MTRIKTFGAIVLPALLLVASGCAEDQTPRSYVQANAVEKSLFEGEWYYRTCVIRTDYESGDMAFPGDCSADWINYAGGVSIPRIRWLIDQNYLVAIRSYEFVEGANVEWNPILGEPVLAFAIQSHFDIRRDYNPLTGEEVNVIVENDVDRHWWEREFVRVDWSQNLITTTDVFTAALYDLVDIYSRDPAPFFVQEGSDDTGVQWPDTYKPRFLRTSAAEDAHEGVSRVADYGGENELYYMDFVTQEIYTPGNVNDPYTGQLVPWCMSIYIDAPICTSSLITMRNSFLKVPPHRQYEKQEWPDSRHNEFGFWRVGRPTYDAGDAVDPADPFYGMTDFWTWPVGRFNIWQNTRDASGELAHPRDRTVRKTIFYTTTETPLHLLRPAVRIPAEWNRYFMKMVRVLQGRPLPSWDDGEVADADWIYDYETGDAYRCDGGADIFGFCDPARRQYAGEPYDCRLAIDSRDTGVNVPAAVGRYAAFESGTTGESDFDADRFLSMEGDECVIVGRVNSCIRHPAGRDGPDDPGEPCEERGDLRYSFISYVNDPTTGWAGVAEMRSDPITGEYVAGEANCGGPALDSWRTRILTEIDLETGHVTEEEFYMGEYYREYVTNMTGLVDRPAVPQREFPRDLNPGQAQVMNQPLTAMTANMERAFARAQQLKGETGRRNVYSNRVQSLIGTDIERLLFDTEEALAANDIAKLPPGMASTLPQRLDVNSHFRRPLVDQVAQWRHMEERFHKGCVYRPAVFVDNTLTFFVNRLQEDYPGIVDRPQLSFLIEAMLYHPLIFHEFGHVLGLRHNFAGSTDSTNYFPQYWNIVESIPMPDETDPRFDANGDGHLDNTELAAFADEQNEAIQARELAGVKWWANAAVMDYTGNWYDELSGNPSYDLGAMWAGYGDVLEVWEEDPGTDPRSDRSDVHYWKYYHGGEPCSTNADCPYATDGAHGDELVPEQVDAGVVQTCTTWNTDFHQVQGCSNIRQDLRAARAAGGRFVDRKYKFCSDEQNGYQADCSTFDEGANYREIVHNLRDYWDRNYLRFAFRRYRYTFDYYPYMSGFMRFYDTAQKIFQDLFHKWAANIGNYRESREPFGFYDQYMASVDVMNWFIQTLAQPNVGSYIREGWRDRYTWNNRFLDRGELNIPLGVGKYTYSLYQGGLDGINRLERVGTLYDKLWTMELMLSRWWGYGYTIDEPYFVNMYDLFPSEINYLMTGLLADEPGFYMPRVLSTGSGGSDTRIIYPMFWRGACLVDDSGTSPCWTDDTTLSALSPLESASFYVQMVGLTYGLAEIPTSFDPVFQEQAQVYVVGSGGGARVPTDARLCAVGQTQDCEYATFTSERFRREYLAFRIEPDVRGTGGASLGFAIVQKAATQQQLLNCMEQALVDAGGEWGGYCSGTTCENAAAFAATRCGVASDQYPEALSQLRYDVDSYESFIRYLLELQGAYGLNTWISYSGSLE